MTRCLIADDHPGVTAGLSELLSDAGFEITGTARNGEQAIAIAREEQPACAVVDYRMPGLHGPDLLAELRSIAPSTAIVVYTAEASAALADEALAAGAAGVVLKESPLSDVIRAIETALSGATYVDADLTPIDQPRRSPLTERETEVLALVADGLSYEEIGGRLGWIR